MKRVLFLIGFVLSAFGFVATNGAVAEESSVVAPVTYGQVISACSIIDNRDNCFLLVDQYVAQVLASGEPQEEQLRLLNDLVSNLADVAAIDPELNALDAQIADAIDRIAANAPRVVNVAAVKGIAETVRSGDYIPTAAINPNPSPN